MEWSDRDDAWGDDAWDDADAAATPHTPPSYPPAPVPAHERTWRHPSEVGQHSNQAWALAEPPVALGRGLLVTTGMIGCAIGVAILWLMVPAGGDPPTAETATSNRAAASAPRLTTATPADRGDEESAGRSDGSSFGGSTATLLTSTTRPPEASSVSTAAAATLPGEDSPTNTVLVVQEDDAPPAVAVLIGDSPFLVTTANAVGELAQLDVTFDGGDVGTATVVTVDEAVAFLEPSSSAAGPTVGFSTVAEASDGDRVHALGGEVVSFTFGDPDALAGALDEAADDAIVEGTPVVDEQGALVGLCTHGDDGWSVVAIGTPPDAPAGTTSTSPADSSSTEPATSSGSTTAGGTSSDAAYLGVSLGTDDAGYVLVLAVEQHSPADLAGLIPGQRLVAIDGTPVGSAAELVATIRGHRPGDAVTLTMSASTFPLLGNGAAAYAAVTTTVATGATSSTSASVSVSTTTSTTTTTTSTAPSGTTVSSSTAPTTTVGFETYDVIVVLGERAPSV